MQELDSLAELLLMLLKDERIMILLGLLTVASISDYRSYRIPNWLTVGGMTTGLIYSAIVPFSVKLGFLWALGGLAVGLLVLLPLYAFRMLGAGDVKLMAMVGAFLGVTDVLHVVVYSLIAGGIAALGFALFNRVLGQMFANVRELVHSTIWVAFAGYKPDMRIAPGKSVGRLPYAVCISVGTLYYVVANQLGYA